MKVIGKVLANAIYSFKDGWRDGKRLNNFNKEKQNMIYMASNLTTSEFLDDYYYKRKGKVELFNTDAEAIAFHRKYEYVK